MAHLQPSTQACYRRVHAWRSDKQQHTNFDTSNPRQWTLHVCIQQPCPARHSGPPNADDVLGRIRQRNREYEYIHDAAQLHLIQGTQQAASSSTPAAAPPTAPDVPPESPALSVLEAWNQSFGTLAARNSRPTTPANPTPLPSASPSCAVSRTSQHSYHTESHHSAEEHEADVTVTQPPLVPDVDVDMAEPPITTAQVLELFARSQAQIEALTGKLDALATKVTELTTQVTRHVTIASTRSASESSKSFVEKPVAFEGKDSHLARTFLAAFQVYAMNSHTKYGYLDSEGNWKGDDKKWILGAISFLKGDAAMWAAAKLEAAAEHKPAFGD